MHFYLLIFGVSLQIFSEGEKIKTARNIAATVIKAHEDGTYDIEYKKGDRDLNVFHLETK